MSEIKLTDGLRHVVDRVREDLATNGVTATVAALYSRSPLPQPYSSCTNPCVSHLNGVTITSTSAADRAIVTGGCAGKVASARATKRSS